MSFSSCLLITCLMAVGYLAQSDDIFKNKFCAKGLTNDKGYEGIANCMKQFMPPQVNDAWMKCKVEENDGKQIECPQFLKKICLNLNIFGKLEVCMDKYLKDLDMTTLQGNHNSMMECIQKLP